MKEFRASKINFTTWMVIGTILLCPTFGLWIFIMLLQIYIYLNKSIVLNEKTLTLKTGIINIKTEDFYYKQINAVKIDQGVFAKMCHYGTIKIFVGNSLNVITFKNLDYPGEIKAFIDSKTSEAILVKNVN